MAFRATPFLAASVFWVAGILVPLACHTFVEEQRGEVGQACFVAPDGVMSCDENLTCVPLPLDGGGFDGGECFPIDAEEEVTEAADDAADDVVAADASEAGEDGGEGDAALDADAADAESDASIDAPEDAPATDAGTDAKAD